MTDQCGNETYNNILANILSLQTPLTPWVGSKAPFFLKVVMMHINWPK